MTARRANPPMGVITSPGPGRKSKDVAPSTEDRADIAALDAASNALQRGELETVDHADLKRRLGL